MPEKMKSPVDESRRSFLKKTMIGGIAAATFPAMTFADNTTDPAVPSIDIKPGEFDEITITELTEGMKSGKYTARSITEQYISRIKEIDKSGPAINSVIELNPDALAIADQLDKE